MKVGIITLPLHVNYGGILQAYALQEILRRQSHDVSLITIKNNSSRDLIRGVIKKAVLFLDYLGLHHGNRDIAGRNCESIARFIRDNVRIREYRDYLDIPREAYDAFIVGSDQVWRREFQRDIRDVYLRFAKGWDNVKRLAYAVSFGKDTIDYSDRELHDCTELINMFQAVSVREENGVSICKDKLQCNAIQVLDPTLLLQAADYFRIVKSFQPGANKCLVYIMDDTQEFQKAINHIALVLNDSPTIINMSEMDRTGDRLSIECWLSAFRDASFVLTDSFHGCVFSILFHKRFAVLDNVSGGVSRIDSLLRLFGLKSRECFSISDLDKALEEDIDWDNVERVLLTQREKSLRFLSDNLR